MTEDGRDTTKIRNTGSRVQGTAGATGDLVLKKIWGSWQDNLMGSVDHTSPVT